MRQLKVEISILALLSLVCIVSFALDMTDEHFNMAREFLNTEQYMEAAEEFKAVVKLESDGSTVGQNAKYWVGQCYFRMGQFDEALSIFDKIIKEYPDSAIVPVTQLMIIRVQREKENEKLRAKRVAASDKKVIIDSKTGVKYIRINSLTDDGKYITGLGSLSPNGKFRILGKRVIPMDGSGEFDLVNIPASRGVWSPDGKKVAFHSEGAIWIIPVYLKTGRPTGVAKKVFDGDYWFDPYFSWSPDSERIVFERRDEEIVSDIWILSVKDGTLTKITDDPIWEGRPVWSSDGKTIVYNKGDDEIWLVSDEGEIPRKIIDYGRPVSWSPDSKWLFYTVRRKPWLFCIDDESSFNITPPNEVGEYLAWSPDGQKIIFLCSPYDWVSSLKVVSASGGPSFELGRGLKLWPYVHFWSPDSKMIITEGEGDSTFWIIPLAGGDAFPLELDVSVIGKPHPRSLSLNRNKLLFAVRQSKKTEELWMVPISLKDARTKGSAVIVFSGLSRPTLGGAWAPDAAKYAVIHKGDIWIASAEGSKPVQITKTPEDEAWPAWSPDGKMIAYTLHLAGKEILQVISVSGGEVTKISDTLDNRQYVWSPDGKELAIVSEDLIFAIPLAGGKNRQILDLRDLNLDDAWGLCWSPDRQHLAFISVKEKDKFDHRIFVVHTEGGEVTELAVDDHGEIWWLYWSPDGKWLSYHSDGDIKARPEEVFWEVNIDELVGKSSD